MLSKGDIKYIKSLQVKKYRKQEQSFVVEGAKSVLELLESDFQVTLLLGTETFLAGAQRKEGMEIVVVTEKELESIGEFQSNNAALAVARMKPNLAPQVRPEEYVLVLDDIRDPGNLGTIIRTADWYGIDKIVASAETADVYNPKVISATMGSFTRVGMYYTDIGHWLRSYPGATYGALLSGENIHSTRFEKGGAIVIGNESRGIRKELEPLIRHKITIPRLGKAESLNAAIATAIICDNLRRNA